MHADHRSRLGALVLTAALTAPLGAAPDQGILSHPGGRAPARDIACGPHATWDPPVAGMRVVAGGIHERSLFGPGDVVIVDAGRTQGLEPGQEFFVRRVFRDRFLTAPRGDVPPMSVRTAGWVRLVEVRDDVSTAQVVQVCDAIAAGDHLEPFALPVVPAPGAGEPDYADPARILMGDERRQTGSAGALMVLDRGTERGVEAGQRLTVFRPTLDGGPMRRVAEATVMTVQARTALVRIETSRDAVYVGDLVALHK
jgi:hypothetical protein